MSELRIAARVRDPDLLAGVKTAAATYRARLIQWGDTLGLDPHLHEVDLVVLEAANSNSAVDEFNSARGACPRAEIIIFAPSAATPATPKATPVPCARWQSSSGRLNSTGEHRNRGTDSTLYSYSPRNSTPH